MISATRFIYTAILTVGLLVCFDLNTANAQTINVTDATRQGWAGGVSSRYGQLYTIHIKIVEGKSPLILDTLWVDGYCIDLAKYNPQKTQKGEIRDITIIQNLIFDDEKRDYLLRCHDSDKTGIVFSYHVNKKKKQVDISDLISQLEFIGYP